MRGCGPRVSYMSRDDRMNILVTGGAGFIGAMIAKSLVSSGYDVTVIDNLSRGSRWNVPEEARFIPGDILGYPLLEEVIRKCDAVFHFAANPDVRGANQNPTEYLRSHLNATIRIASCMKPGQILVFASSSTVYGDASVIPTPEGYGPCIPISIYGCMKLACESVISGFSHLHGFKGVILRYANIVGPTGHGVVKDFFRKLQTNSRVLEILGDGSQRKSYCWIEDCVTATIDAWSESILSENHQLEIYNIGSRDSISVVDVARTVCEAMGVAPELRFVPFEGGRGWKGDVKTMELDISKICQVSKGIRHSSRESVQKCIEGLIRRGQPRNI